MPAGKSQLSTKSGSMQPHLVGIRPKNLCIFQGKIESPLLCTHTLQQWNCPCLGRDCPESGFQPEFPTSSSSSCSQFCTQNFILKQEQRKEKLRIGQQKKAEYRHSENMFQHHIDRDSRAHNPEHIVRFLPLSTLAKVQSFKPFNTSSLHNLIKLLVWRDGKSCILVAKLELQ